MNFVQLINESLIKGEPIDVVENKEKIISSFQKAFRPLIKDLRKSAEKPIELIEKIETYSSGLRYFVHFNHFSKDYGKERDNIIKQIKNKLKIELIVPTGTFYGFRMEMLNPPEDLRIDFENKKKEYERQMERVAEDYLKAIESKVITFVPMKIERSGNEYVVFELQTDGMLIGKVEANLDTKNVFLVLPPKDERIFIGTVKAGSRLNELTINVGLDITPQISAKLVERIKNIKEIA